MPRTRYTYTCTNTCTSDVVVLPTVRGASSEYPSPPSPHSVDCPWYLESLKQGLYWYQRSELRRQVNCLRSASGIFSLIVAEISNLYTVAYLFRVLAMCYPRPFFKIVFQPQALTHEGWNAVGFNTLSATSAIGG